MNCHFWVCDNYAPGSDVAESFENALGSVVETAFVENDTQTLVGNLSIAGSVGFDLPSEILAGKAAGPSTEGNLLVVDLGGTVVVENCSKPSLIAGCLRPQWSWTQMNWAQ